MKVPLPCWEPPETQRGGPRNQALPQSAPGLISAEDPPGAHAVGEQKGEKGTLPAKTSYSRCLFRVS